MNTKKKNPTSKRKTYTIPWNKRLGKNQTGRSRSTNGSKAKNAPRKAARKARRRNRKRT